MSGLHSVETDSQIGLVTGCTNARAFQHQPSNGNSNWQSHEESGLSEFNKRTSNGPVVVIITIETPFRQNVGELILGIEVFDLDFWVQEDSISKPVQRKAVRDTCLIVGRLRLLTILIFSSLSLTR